MIKGFDAQPDHKIIAANLYNLALSYGTLGEYRKALDYGGQALAIGERLAAGRDRQFVAVSYNHVGRSHGALGEQSKAIDYYQKATMANPTSNDAERNSRPRSRRAPSIRVGSAASIVMPRARNGCAD